MKKHKSVVAILLAVMMIFTMMPAMAFAATPAGNDSAQWDGSYANVTITKGTTSINYPAGREFDQTHGYITATASDETKSPSQKFASSGLAPETAQFYDLDGAKLATGGSEFKTREFSREDFISYFSTTNADGERVAKELSWQLIAKRPSYDTTSDANVKESEAFVPTGYSVVFDAWKLFDASNTEAQEITVPVEIKLAANAEIGVNALECLNVDKIPSITLKIAKEVTSPAKAQFYFDGKDSLKVTTSGTTINVPALTYDGSAFVLKMKDAEGLSVKYQTLQNGRYTDVNEISVTDVAANPVKARAIVTKGTTSVTYNADLQVEARQGAFAFVFDEDGNVGSYEYGVEGEEYNAMDYLLVAPASRQDKKAVAANAEQLKAYFNDFYQIDATVKKANPNMVALSIEMKEFTSTAEVKALAKKYEQLMANFAMDAATDYAGVAYVDEDNQQYVGGTHAIVWLNDVASTAPEIEFVNTPTSKTYKAKVLKKKAKSFKVKAESTIGAEVSYKLINAPEKIVINKTTGKITLKKGLKKGTYKIKVKAYLTKDVTPDKYGAVSETQSITIKVKK